MQLTTADQLIAHLDELGIAYEMHSHPPVATVAASLEFVSHLPGCKTKNLFLRDRKRRNRFLVVARHDAPIDLKALSQSLGVPGLSFAPPDELDQYLGVQPGAVSVLALVNDTSNAVQLVMDEVVWAAQHVQAHPLDNAKTAIVEHGMLERFLASTGHMPRLIALSDDKGA